MKKIIPVLKLLVIVLIIDSCAVSYHPLRPPVLNYSATDSENGIELAYKYDVLRARGNTRYAKHADKAGLKVVSVRLINQSDSSYIINRDLQFYSGLKQCVLLSPDEVKRLAGQSPATHLFYLFLIPTNLYIKHGSETETFPIGLILGPGLAIGNMLYASHANDNMLNELIYYDLNHKEIKKGETVYGIIGFRDHDYNPITIKLNKK